MASTTVQKNMFDILSDSKNYQQVDDFTNRVYLHESKDGRVNLATFNFPDGKYKVSILNREGDTVSKNNQIIKKGRKVELLRRFEGSTKMTVAQTHTIPLNNINNKVLQFILDSCEDIRKIFIDVSPCMNERVFEDTKKVEFPDQHFDGNDNMGNAVRFTDILKFSEKYMIVKGFMQVGKTKFIISSAVWHMLNGMSSVIRSEEVV